MEEGGGLAAEGMVLRVGEAQSDNREMWKTRSHFSCQGEPLQGLPALAGQSIRHTISEYLSGGKPDRSAKSTLHHRRRDRKHHHCL